MNIKTVKLVLKKSWLWLKTYWYVPAVLIAVIVSYVFFGGKANGIIKAFMQNREGYKHQVKKLNEVHDKEIKAKEAIAVEHKKKVERLKEVKAKKDVKIEEEKKERVEDLKDDDLEELSDKLKDEFKL